MPRRAVADPLAAAIGARIRLLRMERGLTLEKLAYESEHSSKGHLSDIEHGRVVPTVSSLGSIAESLGVLVPDLVCFPEQGPRERLFELSRRLPESVVRQWIAQAERLIEPRALGPTTKGQPARKAPRALDPASARAVASLEPKPRHAVPVFDLAAAAGALSDGASAEQLGWARLPGKDAALPGAFVARVVGHSMEPRIPDGSWALFRRPAPGNRAGRVLLVEHRGRLAPDDGGAYLLKLVERVTTGSGERVILRSLHPTVAPIVIDPVREPLRVVAELARLLAPRECDGLGA